MIEMKWGIVLFVLAAYPSSARAEEQSEELPTEEPAEQSDEDSQASDPAPRPFDPKQAWEMVNDTNDTEDDRPSVSNDLVETEREKNLIFGATLGLHATFVGLHLLISEGSFESTWLYAYLIMLPVDVVVGTVIGNSDRWEVHWGWMLLGSILGNGCGFGLSMGIIALSLLPNAAAGAWWTFWILGSVVFPTVIPPLVLMLTYKLVRKRRRKGSITSSARMRYLPPGPTVITLAGREPNSMQRIVPGVSLGILTF